MPLSISRILDHIIEVEGGYVNDVNDPGGETKYGITKRSYPDLDIKNLTEQEARSIYRRDFIAPFVSVRDERLRLMVIDAGVNHGVKRAERWLRDHPTFMGFTNHRLRFYATLARFNFYGRGWINRIMKVQKITATLPGYADMLVDHRPLWQRVLLAFATQQNAVRFRVRPMTGGQGIKLDVS